MTRSVLFLRLRGCATLAALVCALPTSLAAEPRRDVGWIDAERKKVQPIHVPLLVDSAFDSYREAVAAASEPSEPDDVAEGWQAAVIAHNQATVQAGLAAIRDMVERNEAVLAKLHEGAGRDYMSPTEPDAETVYPWLAKDRSLARLGVAAAHLAHIDGDDALALQRIEDVYALGVNVPRGGVLIEELVGSAILAMASKASTFVVFDGQVEPSLLKAHARRLRELRDRIWPFPKTLAREWQGMMASPDALPVTDWLEDRFARFIEAADQPLGDTAFDALAARTDKDAEVRGSDEEAVLIPVVAKVRTKWLESWGILMADETVACVRACRQENGRYPESLDALVPTYMPEPPTDPWTGKRMVYRAEGDGFTLYATGPDRKDDGGRRGNEYPWLEPDQVFVPVEVGS